ncbi:MULTISPECIES: fimbrial protein [Pseudomonas]|uniref:Type 1 fimbrial protein n=1 Tax=Pseudomonas sessilinigenes TaxID=658629 RepID=A0ABX8MWC7_9PSED|nr:MULTISPECIES: fimbrial protein [Pseudomonas]AZC24607.1 Fimbrial protein precursor [Pseudomonas sessilinigenes]QIH08272.1 type 1 fimbrial protein [Pseudomonas sp. BIOMIG1BAC]QXH43536.1 type 1 fimbrial protein [Pseudomonas sessilinigenes]
MKAIKFLMIASTACVLANSAQAADGTINFTGEITAASCVASAGAGSSVGGGQGQQIVEVNLGKVSMDALGGSAEAGLAAGTSINLNLDCGNTAAGLTTVKFGFDPMSGSGIDPNNNSLLKTTGSAGGVGIGMYDENSQLINLSANEAYSAALTASGEGEQAKYSAALNMRASYVANGSELKPGTANGTLPFTLTYE